MLALRRLLLRSSRRLLLVQQADGLCCPLLRARMRDDVGELPSVKVKRMRLFGSVQSRQQALDKAMRLLELLM